MFETYKHKDTWKNESGIYDEKAFNIIYPQRGREYKVIMTYGKGEDQWLVLQGINAAFPAKFFETNNQYCKVRKN